MKCPNCDGKGYYEVESSYGTEQVKCHCQQEQTNEEWFCNLSTEEKADKLTDFSFWLVPTIPTDEKREQVKRKLTKWLKDKH